MRHPDRARERRDLVLTLMAQQGYVTAEAAAAAKAEPVVTAPPRWPRAPYVVDVVRREAEANGVPVMNGGYQITTTIDAQLQTLAGEALTSGLARAEARSGFKHPVFATRTPGSSDYLQGTVIAMDPENGDVLALVGGRSYADSHFDRAINALRQPGSAFKPIVYSTAIADTFTASSIVYDTALAIPLDRNGVYRPKNDDGQFLGPMTLRDALTRSRNPVAVEIGMAEGIDTIAALAHALGIRTPIAPYPSSAIGASAVRPLDLVAAYAAFDNDGSSDHAALHQSTSASRRDASCIRRKAPVRDSVLDPRVAFIVRDMMRDVVSRGTATSVRRYVPDRIEVAGKTGTTNNDTDAWFVGMTPEIVAGVWVGFDKPVAIAPGAAGGLTRGAHLGRHDRTLLRGAQLRRVESPGGDCRDGLRSRQDGAGGQHDSAGQALHRVLHRWYTARRSVGAVRERADHVLARWQPLRIVRSGWCSSFEREPRGDRVHLAGTKSCPARKSQRGICKISGAEKRQQQIGHGTELANSSGRDEGADAHEQHPRSEDNRQGQVSLPRQQSKPMTVHRRLEQRLQIPIRPLAERSAGAHHTARAKHLS